MKSWEIALRAKRFELAEKTRKAEDLGAMVRDFDTMAIDLARQIQAEEDRTGFRDPTHFSYSTFAKAAALRRDKLLVSVAELKVQLDAAVLAQQAAQEAVDALAADEARGGATRSSHTKLETPAVTYR